MNAPHEIPIDDNVPIPAIHKYPFRHLKVGQSFFAPGVTITLLSSYAWHYKQKFGFQYTMRSRIEQRKKGVRVWRIK